MHNVDNTVLLTNINLFLCFQIVKVDKEYGALQAKQI